MMLKQLKPVLGGFVDYSITSDEVLCNDCEELDTTVNEAREFMETLVSTDEHIFSVQQSEATIEEKPELCTGELCQIICRMFVKSSPSTSTLTIVQPCMQELQGSKTRNKINRTYRRASEKSKR
ncbi:hypothetical protein NC653_022224 [Populus alba x Populus x berolinensis]|uniref:PUB2-4-like N-terminal domain-containing protein n=1 Tax=Populus alba x Populus x berolinensis TaxID=444605 RepID=A0AAD6MED5_9ROSI|nr:hypothetical protein NC653_022224 [Populus alba x Populus x berolinensis]